VKLNTHNAVFVKSAADAGGFIRDRIPKVVFAGRSNAGKSSTINALLNRKGLARVSESPGKTIHINYYLVDKRLYLVDLPGYGFARAAKSRKDEWGKLMDAFFGETSNIDLCVLIVDARHRPSDDDEIMCDYLKKTGIPFVVCANKTDKLKKAELGPHMREIADVLELPEDALIPYSSKTGEGIEALKNRLFGVEANGHAAKADNGRKPSEDVPE